MSRLEGKTAVVTGGASGIGEATARRIIEEGGRVVIADLDEAAGKQLAADLGSSAVFARTDVTSEDDVAGAVRTATTEFGRLDLMFNNAGIIGVTGPIATLPLDDYERTMAVLLRGVVLGMKHAATVMIPQGSGAIISTSSVAGVQGGLGAHVYSAAKAAVIGLTQSVAAELWPHGIRVNAVLPGKVATPMTAAIIARRGGPAEPAKPREQQLREERRGQASDIAAAVVFLASDEGRFITGESLRIDGGLTRAGSVPGFTTGEYSSPQIFGTER